MFDPMSGFFNPFQVQTKSTTTTTTTRPTTNTPTATMTTTTGPIQPTIFHHVPAPTAAQLRIHGNWKEISIKDANKHCLVSRQYSQIKDSGLTGILSLFRSACESDEFAQKCDSLGLREGMFTSNPFLAKGHPSYDQFLNHALPTLADDDVLGIAFHGTAENNIDAISQHGLDPAKRSGQAYGPGEYFAKNPQISVGYCRQGTEMFVFLVVIPRAQLHHETGTAATTTTTTIDSSNGYASFTTTTNNNNNNIINRIRYRQEPPPNFVVVENNNHQLPIGTMTFESVDNNVMLQAQQLRTKLLSLSQKAEEQQNRVEETSIKSAIMQNLMNNHIEAASQQYLDNRLLLGQLSLSEIAWYVHPLLKNDPPERLEAFFPDLPPPIRASELMATADIQPLEVAVKLQSRAHKDLERTQKLLQKKEEEDKGKIVYKKQSNNKSTTTKAVGLVGKPKKDEPINAMTVLQSILHNVASSRLDVASELYMEKGLSILDDFAKKEIALCVNRNVSSDERELVDCLFPNLPDLSLESSSGSGAGATKKKEDASAEGAMMMAEEAESVTYDDDDDGEDGEDDGDEDSYYIDDDDEYYDEEGVLEFDDMSYS